MSPLIIQRGPPALEGVRLAMPSAIVSRSWCCSFSEQAVFFWWIRVTVNPRYDLMSLLLRGQVIAVAPLRRRRAMRRMFIDVAVQNYACCLCVCDCHEEWLCTVTYPPTRQNVGTDSVWVADDDKNSCRRLHWLNSWVVPTAFYEESMSKFIHDCRIYSRIVNLSSFSSYKNQTYILIGKVDDVLASTPFHVIQADEALVHPPVKSCGFPSTWNVVVFVWLVIGSCHHVETWFSHSAWATKQSWICSNLVHTSLGVVESTDSLWWTYERHSLLFLYDAGHRFNMVVVLLILSRDNTWCIVAAVCDGFAL